VATVYDLIPLSHPTLVSQASIDATQSVIESLRSATLVTCISDYVKSEICYYAKFPAERIQVVPLAAAKDVFYVAAPHDVRDVRHRYGIGEGPYILSLSNIERRKNIVHLLRCMRNLSNLPSLREIKLVLVGERSREYPEVDELLASDGDICRRVVFTGFAPNDDLAPLYTGATAFAFPSLAEGFGLPVLEAMQCGTPIVCSDRTSLPGVVGGAGFLLDPCDQDAWCDAFVSIFRDDSLQRRLRIQSIRRSRDFCWTKTAELLVRAYEMAIGAEASTPPTQPRPARAW
jgi:glycosyltransferase involved in cell wall biosynthesis